VISTGFSESVDRRVLGGFVFVDSITGASIDDPLSVVSPALQLLANRSGIYAILGAPGFAAQTGMFDPQPAQWLSPQSFEVTVQDPSLRYLARRGAIQAPQALATLATPTRIPLYASPAAVLAPNWAVVRASVTATAGDGLPWAMLQIVKSDGTVAATGMTDAHGEALLAVMGLGVQVSAAASGAVTEITIPVTVKAWFDPSVRQQPAGWIANPDDILGNLSNPVLAQGSFSGALGAGQVLVAPITIAV
jgi:hypothetical protein